jgi:hypothetical protein
MCEQLCGYATQEEPAAVYEHLAWPRSLEWPRIEIRTRGKLGELLFKDRPWNKGPTVIPAFTNLVRAVETQANGASPARGPVYTRPFDVPDSRLRPENPAAADHIVATSS